MTLEEITGNQPQGGLTLEQISGSSDDLTSKAIQQSQEELERPSNPVMDWIKGAASKTTDFLTPSTKKLGTTLGTAMAAGQTAEDIGASNIAEAESNRKLAELLKRPDLSEEQKQHIHNLMGTAIPTAEEQMPELKTTAKQIAGQAAGTIGEALVGATQPKSVASRIAVGTAIGGLTAGGKAAQENLSGGDIAKQALKGAGVGLAVSGALEGISAAVRGIAKSSWAQKASGRVYNHELQPPTKEVASQIEAGFKTFGEKARDIVDDTGQPVYVGNYNTLLNKAKGEIKNKGAKLMSEASKIDGVASPVMIDDIGTRVLEEMEETLGMLDDNQVAKVINETKRVSPEMSVSQMIEAKRKFDSLIPDSYWLHAGDANTNFISQVRYAYRDALRKAIDEAADASGSNVVKALNNDLSVAMDMKKLAASQMAMRQTQKLPWIKAFQRLVDDTILNPAITTRYAQTLKKAATASAAGSSGLVRGESIKQTSSKLEGKKEDEDANAD